MYRRGLPTCRSYGRGGRRRLRRLPGDWAAAPACQRARRAAHRIELYIAHCPDFISHVHHVCVDLCTDDTVLFSFLLFIIAAGVDSVAETGPVD